MVSGTAVLNDGKIKAAKARESAYRLGDSGQLYLQVTPSGGKHWRMNYIFGRNSAGRPIQKTLSFGSYPSVNLSEARAKRDEAKRVLSQGRDPAEERRAAERAEALERQNSFRQPRKAGSSFIADGLSRSCANQQRKAKANGRISKPTFGLSTRCPLASSSFKRRLGELGTRCLAGDRGRANRRIEGASNSGSVAKSRKPRRDRDCAPSATKNFSGVCI